MTSQVVVELCQGSEIVHLFVIALMFFVFVFFTINYGLKRTINNGLKSVQIQDESHYS